VAVAAHLMQKLKLLLVLLVVQVVVVQ